MLPSDRSIHCYWDTQTLPPKTKSVHNMVHYVRLLIVLLRNFFIMLFVNAHFFIMKCTVFIIFLPFPSSSSSPLPIDLVIDHHCRRHHHNHHHKKAQRPILFFFSRSPLSDEWEVGISGNPQWQQIILNNQRWPCLRTWNMEVSTEAQRCSDEHWALWPQLNKDSVFRLPDHQLFIWYDVRYATWLDTWDLTNVLAADGLFGAKA